MRSLCPHLLSSSMLPVSMPRAHTAKIRRFRNEWPQRTFLLDEHRIAETEEAITLLDSLSVSIHDLLARGEGRNEHHER